MVFAPKNTPPDILQKLNATLNKGYASAEFGRRMSSQGIEVVGGTVAEARAIVQRETDRWAPIVKAANIKAD